MSTDVFSIKCDSLAGVKLVGFRGSEALSRPYEFELFFTVPVGTDVKSAAGATASLVASRGADAAPMYWHGSFARLRLLHQAAERALYVGTLVPKHWFLRHSVRNYVHTKAKLKDFVEKTMKQGGLASADWEFQIDAGAYPEEEFSVQYRESHLDFIHRWLEREGIYYFFEHAPDDGGAEKMKLVDAKDQHDKLLGDGRVRYFPTVGFDGSSGESFRELHVDYALLPASVLITDYNYANPAAPVDGEHAVSGVGRGQIREYGYRVFDAGEAARLAEVKSQSIACRELVLRAMGSAMGLRVGYTFELEDGPAELPTRWLVIQARHTGVVGATTPIVAAQTGLEPSETHRVEIVAIPADVQFRAEQSTPWPRIFGFENGVVDGPATSQYAQIDDQGRYLVRFHFDASDLADGSTSTYMRMMQPHGGTVEGWHFPLRKGTEVVVAFQGGDPDRPVISGVVPNAHRPSTVTSRNHTYNVMRTGGSNHMVIEDLEGSQHIDLFCPHSQTNLHMGGPARHAVSQPPKEPGEDITIAAVDFDLYLFTEGNGGLVVNGDWWVNVGNNYWMDVSGDATIHYVGTHSLNVDGDSNEFYNAFQNITVTSGRTDVVEDGGMEQEITGGLTQTVNDGGKQTVNGGWEHIVTATNKDNYGVWDTKVAGNWTAKMVDASISAANVTYTVKTAFEINCPKVTIQGAEIEVNHGVIKEFSPFSIETFGGKNAFGVEQIDVVAMVSGAWAAKVEFGAMATGAFGIKGETVGFERHSMGATFRATGAYIRQVGANIGNAGVRVWNAAFTKE